jgi:hypothetical protein
LLLLLVVLTYSFKTPFQVSFAYSIQFWMFIPDYVLDVIFFLDMLLNRNYFHYTDAGKVIVDQQEIIAHYAKGRFWPDLLTSFPYDVFAAIIAVGVGEDSSSVVKIVAWTRMPKMFRMLRLKEYSTVIDRGLGEMGFSRGNAGVKLIKLLVTVLLMGHIAACFFFLMAEKGDGFETCSGEDSNDASEVNWGSAFAECKWEGTWMQLQIDDDKVAGQATSFEYYVRSFNWALPTLVVVVIGDVVPLTSNETVYCLLWMLVGVTITLVSSEILRASWLTSRPSQASSSRERTCSRTTCTSTACRSRSKSGRASTWTGSGARGGVGIRTPCYLSCLSP